MPATRTLNPLAVLAERKTAVRARIARRRVEFAASWEQVAKPLRWWDRMRTRWRSLAPWVLLGAVPLASWARQRVGQRAGWLGTVLSWVPTAYAWWRQTR